MRKHKEALERALADKSREHAGEQSALVQRYEKRLAEAGETEKALLRQCKEAREKLAAASKPAPVAPLLVATSSNSTQTDAVEETNAVIGDKKGVDCAVNTSLSDEKVSYFMFILKICLV